MTSLIGMIWNRPRVNKEVERYNRRLWKHMKVFENTEVIKIDLDRRDLTKHGQHMNVKGKEVMAKRIAAAIKRTLEVRKKTRISMKWKEDPGKENQGLVAAKNGVGEGRYPIENQNDSVSVENKSRREEDETAMKTSRRCQKIPVTRRDDFLWTATSKIQSSSYTDIHLEDSKKITKSSSKIDVKTKETLSLDTQLGVSQESSRSPSKKEVGTKKILNKDASTKEYLSTDTHLEDSKETSRNSKLQRNCPKLKNDDFLWN
jgi:hypothetical protein